MPGCPHEGVVFWSQHNGFGMEKLNTETQTSTKRFGQDFVYTCKKWLGIRVWGIWERKKRSGEEV